MHSIGGSQVNRGRQTGVRFGDALDHCLRERQPMKSRGLAISVEFSHQVAQLFLVDRPFAKLAVDSGQSFVLAVQARPLYLWRRAPALSPGRCPGTTTVP